MIRASKIFDKGIKNLYDKIVCEKVFFLMIKMKKVVKDYVLQDIMSYIVNKIKTKFYHKIKLVCCKVY